MAFSLNGHSGPVRPKRALDPRDDFRRTVFFTVVGALLPGLGLVAARRRKLGFAILAAFILLILGLVVWALTDLDGLVSLAVNPRFLLIAGISLAVGGLVWVGVILATHLNLRSTTPPRLQRVLGSILVGGLAFCVAAPCAVAARYAYDQSTLVTTVFQSEKDTKSATRPTMAPPTDKEKDPWADKPRLNVLLLGGDDASNRTGTRTDTVILASIDTLTGDTSLFSLPRNTGRMPFPKDSALSDHYPNGFYNGYNGDDAEFFLNAMYDNVPNTVPEDVLGETDNLGADALKLSVGEALGLEVDYYVLVNLAGFKKLINALGGITVNINSYVAVGGDTDRGIQPDRYLEPGADQHLNGGDALWFARGRYGSDDFERMDRQRCVINAVIKQANPTTLATRYEAIARASKDIIQTDVPQEMLSMLVELSLRVKDGNIRSIVFKHGANGFSSPDPDFDLMRERVKKALGEAKSDTKDEKKKEPKKSTKPSSPSSSTAPPDDPTDTPDEPSATPTTESEDVADSCAYDSEAAESAPRPPGY